MAVLNQIRASGPLSLVELNTTLPGRIVLSAVASLFVAACAHLIVPLPFTPVPLTLGDFAVLLVGLVLGPATGFAALSLYLVEGASGLPVFSPAGPGGTAQLFGATGGYLLAYPVAAALAGASFRVLSGLRSRFAGAVLAGALGSAFLMLTGTVWLALLLHLSSASAFEKGALPFLPGQLVKVIAAAGIVTSTRRWHRA